MLVHLIVVVLNYRTAPVEVRERFALSEREMPLALQALKQTTGILEGVIVATCNRTELYAVVDRNQLC
jgi:glutamyl-tRNA reductase